MVWQARGSARVFGSREAPAEPQSSEFDPESKLDLPLVIRQLLCDPACTRARGFRERAQVT